MAYEYQTSITAGTKQYTLMLFQAYVSDERFLNGAIDFENISGQGAYQATASTGAIISLESGGRPTAANKFGNVYSPSTKAQAPMLGTKREPLKVTTSAIFSGVKITNFLLDMTFDRFICLVLKNSITAGGMGVVISSDPTGATDSETFSFTTSPTANTWQKNKIKKGNGTKTGAIDYSKISYIFITSDVANPLGFICGAFFTASEEICFPGEVITMNITCITALDRKLTVDTTEVLCSQVVNSIIATKKSLTLDIEFKETNELTRAILKNSLPTYGEREITEVFGIFNILVNGTVTGLPTSLNIASVSVDGQTLSNSSFVSNIDESYYNYSGSVLTFNASEHGNKKAKIFIHRKKIGSGFKDVGLVSGLVGRIEIKTTTESLTTKRFIIPKLQLMSSEDSSAEDGDSVKMMGQGVGSSLFEELSY